MKSVMDHNFSKVPSIGINRSKFDRSHGYKTTFDAGYLTPIFIDEVLPGDGINLSANILARMLSPLDRPIMDNIHLDVFYFSVPLRLIWDNFQKFMGEQVDPGDSIDYLVPTVTADAVNGHVVGSLYDYFGVPTGVASLEHANLFGRAYNLIYNEWFRSEVLQDSIVVDRDDGPDTVTDYVLKRAGKRFDYFTSALPWPQRGDAVALPLGSVAPVLGIGVNAQTPTTGPRTVYETGQSASTSFAKYYNASTGIVDLEDDPNNTGFPGVYADLTGATAATINDLREAFQIQKLLERDARGGTRYTEILQSHFQVTSPDFRLQRPEYLGGGSTRLGVNQVPQTSSTDATSGQGNLAAYGVGGFSGIGFSKSFTEHCVVIGLIRARADLTYQQGLDRMWSRSTRYDFYWPELAHLGEQEILNKEIYADGSANDDLVFGYIPRYDEYRYKPSKVTGQLRSSYATPLDSWHLSEDFASLPVLNASFIECNPPMDRIKAVTGEPDFVLDSYNKMISVRPMPTYAVPGLIDHF